MADTVERQLLLLKIDVITLLTATQTLARAVRHLADIQEDGRIQYRHQEPTWLPWDTVRSAEQAMDEIMKRISSTNLTITHQEVAPK